VIASQNTSDVINSLNSSDVINNLNSSDVIASQNSSALSNSTGVNGRLLVTSTPTNANLAYDPT